MVSVSTSPYSDWRSATKFVRALRPFFCRLAAAASRAMGHAGWGGDTLKAVEKTSGSLGKGSFGVGRSGPRHLLFLPWPSPVPQIDLAHAFSFFATAPALPVFSPACFFLRANYVLLPASGGFPWLMLCQGKVCSQQQRPPGVGGLRQSVSICLKPVTTASRLLQNIVCPRPLKDSATLLRQFGASLEARRSSDATSPHWPPMWRRRWASGLSSAAQCGVPGTSEGGES